MHDRVPPLAQDLIRDDQAQHPGAVAAEDLQKQLLREAVSGAQLGQLILG